MLATDEAILDDLPAWCRRDGHAFLGVEREGPVYRGYCVAPVSTLVSAAAVNGGPGAAYPGPAVQGGGPTARFLLR